MAGEQTTIPRASTQTTEMRTIAVGYETAVNDCYDYLVFEADLETAIAKRVAQQMRDKLKHKMRASP